MIMRYNFKMVKRFLRKYLVVVFVLATLVGAFHHHEDAKIHNDCKICVIHSNLVNIDTPSEAVYLSLLTLSGEAIVTPFANLFERSLHHTYLSRAPPFSPRS